MSKDTDLRAPGAAANADAGTEAALTRAALDYHRFPTPGKISVQPTKDMSTQRDLALAYSPGVAAACMAIAHAPDEAYSLTAARQPRGGHHQRHGGARPRQYRRARRQARDGGQGLPVQEVRRHRRVRHRGRRDRSGEVHRDRRPPGADLRRHQPRGHQGSRMLRHRDEAARAHEDPGLPRRPARHRHRGRRRPDQRASRWWASRSRSATLVCSGAGAAAIACLNILVGLGLRKENIVVCDSRGVVSTDRMASLDEQKRAYARDTTARTLGDVVAGADIFLGVSQGGVLKPEMVGEHGRQADHPGARQPRPGDPAGTGQAGAARLPHRHRALGLPEPGQQRPVLPLHLPGRPRRRRHRDQRGHEARRRARHRRPRPCRAVGRGGRRLRGPRPALRARLPHPAPLRPAPDHHRRPGGGPGRHRQRRRHPALQGRRDLPPLPGAPGLHLRHGDAAGLRRRLRGRRSFGDRPPADRLCRG